MTLMSRRARMIFLPLFRECFVSSQITYTAIVPVRRSWHSPSFESWPVIRLHFLVYRPGRYVAQFVG